MREGADSLEEESAAKQNSTPRIVVSNHSGVGVVGEDVDEIKYAT